MRDLPIVLEGKARLVPKKGEERGEREVRTVSGNFVKVYESCA